MEVTHLSAAAPQGAAASSLSGHTLTEVLVALAISGILLATALPGLSSLFEDNRMTVRINGLVRSLNLARSEAIKRMTPVMVCKSPEGDRCDRTSEWHHGWLVFADRDRNRRFDPGEPRIEVKGAYESGFTIGFGSFYSHGSYVLFKPNGFTRTNGTFTFCDGRGAGRARTLIISKTGRLRMSDETGSGRDPECG